ncbi:glycosyltransferase [Carboxylicivirga sp. M1479]|uniref:glycosyltransferase n=1 Tax=Carboxylicivirga sp. M1479 TaxID=2594476 RepID=UPI002102DBAF|nr:glycosyltransferase [Carboxylicivirga sp. M1479]
MIEIAILILLLPLVAYASQIADWYFQWVKSAYYEPIETQKLGVSVIIPFKDEASNLGKLIDSLQQQVHPKYEIILVNDQSEDESLTILHEKISKQTSLDVKLHNTSSCGKKAAILTGVNAAKYPLIITTDADCTFHPEWLTTLTSFYHEKKADLIIGPVSIQERKGYLNRFQRIDFAALQLCGGAAALQQKPIMCNGANLMGSKEDYLQAQLQPEIASGDDMFLLEWMKQKKRSIHFVKSYKAAVLTNPCNTLKEFLQQRSRWAKKAPHYKDKQIIRTGLVVTLLNAFIPISLLASIWSTLFLFAFAAMLVIKTVSDYSLLKAGSQDFKIRITLFEVFYWQLHYPIYVLAVLLFPLFYTVKWKSRSI